MQEGHQSRGKGETRNVPWQEGMWGWGGGRVNGESDGEREREQDKTIFINF